MHGKTISLGEKKFSIFKSNIHSATCTGRSLCHQPTGLATAQAVDVGKGLERILMDLVSFLYLPD